jgi:hypothetical protein
LSSDSIIRDAIEKHQLLTFDYDGHSRVIEPHAFGVSAGEAKVWGYQIGGTSGSGRLPDWRLFLVYKISRLTLSSERFAGPRKTSGQRNRFDMTYATIGARPHAPVGPAENQRSIGGLTGKPVQVVRRLPDHAVSPLFVAALPSHRIPLTMLDPEITALITKTIEMQVPQFEREFREELRRVVEKDAANGRHGGIALHFPNELAGNEIDRRADFAWEHIKAVLAAGGVAPNPSLVADVEELFVGLKAVLTADIHTEMNGLAGRNHTGAPTVQLDRRWTEALARARAGAEVYALALASQKEGRTTAPPGITLSGTIHSAVIQTGSGATANVHQVFEGGDAEHVRTLLDKLIAEIATTPDDSGKKQLVTAVIQDCRKDADTKAVSVKGLAEALTFVLGTWKKLRDLGAMTALRVWLAAHHVQLPDASSAE